MINENVLYQVKKILYTLAAFVELQENVSRITIAYQKLVLDSAALSLVSSHSLYPDNVVLEK